MTRISQRETGHARITSPSGLWLTDRRGIPLHRGILLVPEDVPGGVTSRPECPLEPHSLPEDPQNRPLEFCPKV